MSTTPAPESRTPTSSPGYSGVEAGLAEVLERRYPGVLDRMVPVADGLFRIRVLTDRHPDCERLVAGIGERLAHTERLVVDEPADAMLALVPDDEPLGRGVVDPVADWVGPVVLALVGRPVPGPSVVGRSSVAGPAGDESSVSRAIAVLHRARSERAGSGDSLGEMSSGALTVVRVPVSPGPDGEIPRADIAMGDASGVDALVAALRAAPRATEASRRAALSRLVLRRIAADLDGEQAQINRLTAERAAVVLRRNALASSSDEMRRKLQTTRVHLLAMLGSVGRTLDLQVRDLATFTRGRLDTESWTAVEQRISEATVDLEERLGAAIATEFSGRAGSPGAAGSSGAGDDDRPAAVTLAAPRLAAASDRSGERCRGTAAVAVELPPLPAPAAVDRAAPAIGAVVGAGLGRAVAAATGSAITESVTVAAMIVGAIAMAVITLRARRRPIERARFERWCSAAVAEVRAGWERELLDVLFDHEARALGESDRLRRSRLDTADALLGRIDGYLRRGRALVLGLERDAATVAAGRHGDGTVRASRAS